MRKTCFPIFMIMALLMSCSQETQMKKEQPNVILIVSDDQGYADLSCSGLAKDLNTPHMDQLAQDGIRFTQAYATSPICSPSRAGIITGCYQQRWGTYWYGGDGIHDSNYQTIAELLKEEDYITGYVGKVHYGSYDNDTANRNFPLNHGFDYYLGHTSPRKHYLNHQDQLEDAFQVRKKSFDKGGQSLRQQALWKNKGKLDTLAFSTELFGKEACRFIEEHQTEKFFLQISFNAVHNFTHQLPEAYLNEMGLKGYHDWNPETEDYYDWYQAGRNPNHPEGRALYLGQLHFLDQELGRVLSKLEELGLKENTLIIYISDNGGSTPIYANNFPLRGSKYLLYEGGIRVPMIISYPRLYGKGEVKNNMVSAMDILPTICTTLGIEIPENVNGMDLTPLLTNQNPDLHHDTLFWDTHQEVAVRAGKWKYRMANDDQNAKYEMVEVELGEFLYDLEMDIGETDNLATIYPEIFEQLKRSYTNWKRNINDTSNKKNDATINK